MSSNAPHLSELHRHAREAGIEQFRMLRREELIERLREQGVEISDPPARESGGGDERRGAGRQRGRRGGRGREREGGRQRERAREDEQSDADAPTTPKRGVLDITPRGHGFLRGQALQADDGDVYVSASQIRRCVLRAGDVVSGPAREPRRDERYPALVHVDSVNDGEPVEERPTFDDLTPIRPERALNLDLSGLPSEARAALDAYEPLQKIQAGERVLIRASAAPDRFDLLRSLAQAAEGSHGAAVAVLLIDVPPEELAAWRGNGGEALVAALPADSSPAAAGRIARLALEQAKRRAESGADAILIVDSLTRLAVFEEDVAGVKRLFGAGRALEEGGSLTVIATTLGDDDADRAVATTESARVELDTDG